MKTRKITGIFGILLILALLFAALPMLPVFAADDIYLYPNEGKIGDTVTINGVFTATSTERWAAIYFSPSNLALGAVLSTAPTYKQITSIAIPSTQDVAAADAGKFTTTFSVPSTITTSIDPATAGTVAANVSEGTYYIYITIVTGAGNAGIVASKATFTVVSATLDPLSPTSGPPGTQVTITGSNFQASTPLVFTYDTTTTLTPTGDTSTRSTGLFLSIITIPSSAIAGVHTITVTAGATSASAYFTVTGTPTTTPPTSTTSLSIEPSSGSVNATINVGGSGFLANSAITILYDDTLIKQTNTNASGLFSTSFVAPSSTHGIHTITASDGTNSATADFTMESDSPLTPQPVRPYMSEAVAFPLTFDWGDVTDNSTPITYSLQISTGNFTADSIIISKTGITTSQYTLTAADEIKLSSGITYYWRVKAIDAAYNESLWTGTSEFSISTPFSFIGWPLYVTFSIIAVFLFLLGIWLGRKTAFNY